MRVQSLGREDPLEEGMASHSSYSCLEKSGSSTMDRGAWQTTVHGISKTQTRLKQLSTHPCNKHPTLKELIFW